MNIPVHKTFKHISENYYDLTIEETEEQRSFFLNKKIPPSCPFCAKLFLLSLHFFFIPTAIL